MEHGFFLAWDDSHYVSENPHIRAFGLSHLYWMATAFHACNWHPLTWFSHALDYALWGHDPWGHHLGNVALHLANSLLVLPLTVLLLVAVNGKPHAGENRWPPVSRRMLLAGGASGLLFAVHPQHVEVVAWISERKELLCTFFYLLSLISYLLYARRQRRWWLILTLLSFILALAAKPMAVSLPLVLLLLDGYPLHRWTAKRQVIALLREKLWFFPPTLAVMVLTILAQANQDAIQSLENLGLTKRLFNAANSLIFYLQKWLLPQALSPFYPYPDWILEPGLLALLPVLAVVAITLLAVREWTVGRRFWLATWLYYTITLLPVLGIVQVGSQAAADRYAYLPTLGLYILAGVAFARLLETRWRWPVLVTSLLLVAILIPLARQQTTIWRDDETLFQTVFRYYPDRAYVPYYVLAYAFMKQERYEQATVLFHKILTLAPGFFDANLYLADIHARQGDFKQAIQQEKIALSKVSDKTSRALILIRIADRYGQQGQYEEAQRLYRQVLEVDSNRIEALYGLALVATLMDRWEQAEPLLRQTLARDADYRKAILLLAILQHRRGEKDLARERYRQVLRLDPENSTAKRNLAALEQTKP